MDGKSFVDAVFRPIRGDQGESLILFKIFLPGKMHPST